MTQSTTQSENDSVLSHLKDKTRECPECGSEMSRRTGDRYNPPKSFDWYCTGCDKVIDMHPEVRKLYKHLRSELHCDNDSAWFMDRLEVKEQKDRACDQVIVSCQRGTIWMSDLEELKEAASEIGYDIIEVKSDKGGRQRYKVRIVPNYDTDYEEVKE